MTVGNLGRDDGMKIKREVILPGVGARRKGGAVLLIYLVANVNKETHVESANLLRR